MNIKLKHFIQEYCLGKKVLVSLFYLFIFCDFFSIGTIILHECEAIDEIYLLNIILKLLLYSGFYIQLTLILLYFIDLFTRKALVISQTKTLITFFIFLIKVYFIIVVIIADME